MQANICGNICERHCGKAFFAKNNQIKKFVCILMMSKILNDFLVSGGSNTFILEYLFDPRFQLSCANKISVHATDRTTK